MNEPPAFDDLDEIDYWQLTVDASENWDVGPSLHGLEMLPAQPAMAAVVTAIDAEDLEGHDQIRLMQAQQRLISHATALLYRSMAEIVDSIAETHDYDHDDVFDGAADAAAAEIGAALNLTRRAAENELATALDLRRRLPQLWNALLDGRIDVRRAKTILRGTDHLSMAHARTVTDEMLRAAPSLTTGQIAAALRRLALEVEPDDAERRYERAHADRRVVAEPTVDGTGNLLGLDLAPDRLASGVRRLNRLAQGLCGPNESRSMDQLRADLLLDLLNGVEVEQAGRSGRVVVDIHVDLTTLVGLDDRAGEVAGFGPVIADVARKAVAAQHDAEWRVTVTDPSSGDIVHGAPTRYRPTAAERREVHARYRTCVHPGCRMPATQCDLDHIDPYAGGGATNADNLAPLCRHHHRIRHRHGWSYERLGNGNHRWLSPLGHAYTVPASYRINAPPFT